MTTKDRSGGGAWAGWIMFAGLMLVLVGSISAIQGLAALFKDEVYLVTDTGLLVSTDWTTWGWWLLAWGVLLILAGMGLFSGRSWARWFAIVVVFVNLIGQFAFFPAYPLWSIVTIALNVFVLFALTARWQESKLDFA
ncbi:MAG: hypothetical protein AB7I08_02490 [Thermoleophilia bacterium]